MQTISPKLIIGLGNPLPEYAKTYHNVGFLAIDYFVKNSKFSKSKLFEYLKIGDLTLIKPLTFMNESGKAVAAAVKRFKAKPEDILVVHDDSDIALGDYKISFGRGSAGHRGAESIIKSLKTKNFWRLRIGIRKVLSSKYQVLRKRAGDLVLKKISPADLKTLAESFKEARNKIINVQD